MPLRRLLAVTVAGGLLALDPAASAYAAEPGHPTGTFTLERTSTYLRYNPNDDSDPYASLRIHRSNLADDETPAAGLVTEVLPGDGTGPHVCTGTGAWCYLTYSTTGTFTPKVRLTDGDDQTTEYALPQVRILEDATDPVARLTAPKPRLRHRMSAWRVIRGTAVDTGVGLNYVKVVVLQKRHGWWYYYNPYQVKWHKGLRTEAATRRRIGPPGGDAQLLANNAWRTPRVRGLTRGPIVVRLFAQDYNANESERLVAWNRITRR